MLSTRNAAPRSVLQGQFQQDAPAPLAPLPLQNAAPATTPPARNANPPAQKAPAPLPAR